MALALRGRGLSGRRKGGKSLETRPLSVSLLPLRSSVTVLLTDRRDGRTAGRKGFACSVAHFLLSIVHRNKIGEITGAVRRLFTLPVEYLKIDFP